MQIDIDEALRFFGRLYDTKSPTLKVEIVGEYVEDLGMIFLLNLMASGIIRRPSVVHNTYPVKDPLGDIIKFINTNRVTGIPHDVQRVLGYLSHPRKVGLTTNKLYQILIDLDIVESVHEHLGTLDVPGCVLCGDAKVMVTGLCEHCEDVMEEFTEFRSEDHFHVLLNHDNFPRPLAWGKDDRISVSYEHYDMVICCQEVLFTRTKSFQAPLPFKEYQKFDGI